MREAQLETYSKSASQQRSKDCARRVLTEVLSDEVGALLADEERGRVRVCAEVILHASVSSHRGRPS